MMQTAFDSAASVQAETSAGALRAVAPPSFDETRPGYAAPRQQIDRPLATGRVPGLDGLRGISILMVSVSHFVMASTSPLPAACTCLRHLGRPAVDIFFVISGFLITLLLLREMDRSGTISLAGFYKRRALRILPAYAAFLFVTFVFARMGLVPMTPTAWASALTYTVNCVDHHTAWIGHVWSLSVEEHFYLVWPVVLFAVGRRVALCFLLATLPLAAILRYSMTQGWGHGKTIVDVDLFTLTRMDTIAIGCLLAFVVFDGRAGRAMNFLRSRPNLAICGGVVVFLLSTMLLSRTGKYSLFLAPSVEAVAIAAVLFVVVSRTDTGLSRALNSRCLVALGALSYSLYIWQPLLHPPADAWPYTWPINVGCAIGLAVVSYWYVERPFLALKAALK